MMQILRPPGSLLLDFSNGAAYVDEQFVPIIEAKISILEWVSSIRWGVTYDVAHVWIANPDRGPGFNVPCKRQIMQARYVAAHEVPTLHV